MVKDITGQRFGKLLVLNFIGLNKYGRSIWQCKCDCGTIKDIQRQHLIQGNTHSCGCLLNDGRDKRQFINETGKKYNKLTAISYEGKGKWKFKCDCGNFHITHISYVRQGKTKSCGCLWREYQQKLKNKEIKKSKYSHEEQHKLRISEQYKIWQRAIKKKDYYTCQKCGQVGYTLHSHHIESFIYKPHLRFDLGNGITLCQKCHRRFHSKYGLIHFNRQNLQEFLQHPVI